MSYRCLETWTFENQTINLSKITDFSIITSEIEGYTAPTYTLLFNQDTLPSWVTTEDAVYTFNTDTNSYDFIKTDELSIVFGKYVVSGNTWYGAIIYSLLSNTVVDYWGNRWSDNKPRYYYVAIVVDDISERAFLLLYTDYTGASSSVKRYSGGIISFMYNNIDLLYDAVYGVYRGGGAGSGYIGNSLLSNKKMIGYNVPTSSAEGTKTESVNEVSASAVSGKPKSGNGFARIKFLRDLMTLESVNKNQDVTNYVYSQSDGSSVISSYISGFGNNVGTDKILKAGTADKTLSLTDGVYEITTGSSTHCNILIPIQRIAIKKMTFKAKVNKTYSTSYAWGAVDIADIPNSSNVDYSSLNCIRRLPCSFGASGYDRVWDRSTDDWEDFVFTWQNAVYINYFGFEANNSYVAIKDVIFFD